MHTVTAARHSCESPDWYTPASIVEPARRVLNGIDLDPASDAQANLLIKARHYFTADENGLEQPWFGNVFLNPPGGLVRQFWERLDASYRAGTIRHAIWIGYSLEQLQTLQTKPAAVYLPTDFPLCIPKRRIAFLENEARIAHRVEAFYAGTAKTLAAKSPSHGNYIAYLGPYEHLFAQQFQHVGAVLNCRRGAADAPR